MNVLSLFDGKSCGQIALNEANIPYDNYFASEIDKHAIKVTQHNYPRTIQLGDITKIKGSDLPQIDLLFGGSPCQSVSKAGKGAGFDGKSGLFFEFLRVLNEVKPKYWFLENVVMKKEWEDVISNSLGVKSVMINSSLLSAQNRNRLYWANFKIEQPEDRNIFLNDILDDNVNENPGAIRGRYLNKATIVGRRLNERGVRDDYNHDIKPIQCLEVRDANSNKSNCLTTVQKDNVLTSLPVGRHVDVFNKKLPFRYYSLKECCRLQTVPEDYFDGVVSETQAKKMLGNGWTVSVISHILKQIKF